MNRILIFDSTSLRLALSVCLALSVFASAHAITAKQPSQSGASASPQLEELLQAAGTLAKEYTSAFKNLTAEEIKVFELYDKSGNVTKRRRIVSDFVVYQSQQDSTKTAEYRSVREVDSDTISKREQRVGKVIDSAGKAKSIGKELDRINREGTRYDFGYNLTGYTIYKGLALWNGVRQSFKFEVEGREKLNNREVIVLKFEQTKPRNDLFRVDLPRELKPSDSHLRGRLWIDAETKQLWREHNEIVFRSPYAPEPLTLISAEYDFKPSSFGIWLPQRVTVNYFRLLKVNADKKMVEMYRSARASHEYTSFKRFAVDVEEGQVSPHQP